MKPPAQDMPYWDTKTSLSKSESGIKDHLRAKNCKHVGSLYDEDKGELVVIFTFLDEPYRMAFHPLTPGRPGRRSKANLPAQAERQMGRMAFYWIKSAVMMAIDGQNPEVLMPYKQLPGGGPTLQQLKEEGLLSMLSAANDGNLALPAQAGEVLEGEVIE